VPRKGSKRGGQIATASDVLGWTNKLRQAMYDGVSEQDAKEVVQGIVTRAKAGDKTAIQLFFKYLVGEGKAPSTLIQNNYYGHKADPDAEPGSPAKVADLQQRAAAGQALFGSNGEG